MVLSSSFVDSGHLVHAGIYRALVLELASALSLLTKNFVRRSDSAALHLGLCLTLWTSIVDRSHPICVDIFVVIKVYVYCNLSFIAVNNRGQLVCKTANA